MRHLIRQGEGPAAAIQRHHAEARSRKRTIDQLVDTPEDPTTTRRYRTTAGGDETKLRGIPAIARGVPGHIPGTRP
jgi:hypothetical protein